MRARSARTRLLLPAWSVFAAVNLWLMYLLPGSETIPFHFIWLSLALVYGLGPWRLGTMVVALAIVAVTTGGALVHHAQAAVTGFEETAEVPLMAAIFLAMVWHVCRRQRALQQVQRLAAVDRDRADTQRMFVQLGSHEMRSPITVVRGYTELIRAEHDDEQTLEDTGIVIEELDRLDAAHSGW